jgi:RimJ/RimL family protein N-acetyltransferase
MVWLERWGPEDLTVLERSNTPEMTMFLGGPETADKLHERHARFLRYWDTGEACMFRIRSSEASEPVGSVGYWTTEWRDEPVYETGWSVHTAHQGHGIASRALAECLRHAAEHGDRNRVLAFPRVDNAASNALCGTVGFRFQGEEDFEYPKGNPIRVNVWLYELAPAHQPVATPP